MNVEPFEILKPFCLSFIYIFNSDTFNSSCLFLFQVYFMFVKPEAPIDTGFVKTEYDSLSLSARVRADSNLDGHSCQMQKSSQIPT